MSIASSFFCYWLVEKSSPSTEPGKRIPSDRLLWVPVPVHPFYDGREGSDLPFHPSPRVWWGELGHRQSGVSMYSWGLCTRRNDTWIMPGKIPKQKTGQGGKDGRTGSDLHLSKCRSKCPTGLHTNRGP